MKRIPAVLAVATVVGALFAVGADVQKTPAAPPTVEEAKKFLDGVEERMLTLANEASRAGWVQSTFITDDTETLAALANQRLIAATVNYAKEATRFDKVQLPPDMTRKMLLLKLSLDLAAPADPKESAEVTRLAAAMEGAYGKGKYCPPGRDTCLDLDSTCDDSHECCSTFCANGVCVRRER